MGLVIHPLGVLAAIHFPQMEPALCVCVVHVVACAVGFSVR